MSTIHEFTALSVFAPLLINGDGSDDRLTMRDGLALDRFCAVNGYTLGNGHFSMPADEESFFGTCEATGSRGTVCTFHFVQMRESAR